jgi:putative endonuclease
MVCVHGFRAWPFRPSRNDPFGYNDTPFDPPPGRPLPYYVYLLASRRHGTLYLGVTNDLVRRVHEHKSKAARGFTSRYGVDRLVWFETYEDPISAITREKDIKKWRRDWKIRLIEEGNPDWLDRYPLIAS